ncbi:MAG: phosphoglucomutase/phosphomannomutase family protein [Acidobacteria bacterium]|nr:phosphoglucomutase/phosphomannomutase family protein [Acidobacteriota bacterium]
MAGKKTRRKQGRRTPPGPVIRFGTDGWRGVIARDFTLDNVTRVARGLARYLVEFEDIRRGVVVAYDTRFGADRFARRTAEVITSVGAEVRLARAPTPTPALSYAVRSLGAAAGIMLTASHNPAEWLGIKLKASYGGSASPRAVAEVERLLSEEPRLPRLCPDPRRIEVVDLKPPYLSRLAELVDFAGIVRAGLRLAIDPLHGSAAGYLSTLAAEHGIAATEVRGRRDPLFGGTQPEPIEANLEPLREAVRRERCDLGLASDGDADRAAAVDAAGNFVDPHKIFSLVFRHLVERRGLKGGVAKTFSVSKMIDRMAEGYRVPLYETPIGFKHIAELMLERDLVAGGEESGGIGIRPHLPERDGLLVSLLLAEIVATEGKALAACVAELQEKFGPLHYRRVDLKLDPGQKQRALKQIAGDALRKLGQWTVVGREDLDGTKLYLLNAGWVLVRASGTEPVLRIYAEAPSVEMAARVVASVEQLVRSA